MKYIYCLLMLLLTTSIYSFTLPPSVSKEVIGSKNPIKFNVIFDKSKINPLGLKFLTDKKEKISICMVNYYYHPKIELRIYFKGNPTKAYIGTNQTFSTAVEPHKERGIIIHNSADIMYNNHFTYKFISYLQNSISQLGEKSIKQIKKGDLKIGLPNIIIDEYIKEGDIITSFYEFTLSKEDIDFFLNFNLETLKEVKQGSVKKTSDMLNFDEVEKDYNK